MNWKNLVSLLVAIVMGLAALWIGRNIIMNRQGVTASEGNLVEVIVANKDLEPGHLVTEQDLSTQRWPAGSVSKAIFTDEKAVVGRAVLTPVVKGQTMFENLLAERGSEGGLTALVPDGMRAVAVEITEQSGVGGMLVPGCHVDVIATIHQQDSSDMARTIVENVKVQAVGQRLVRERVDGTKGEMVKTVTLIVTPKDAEAIELAGNSGKLRLVLRGANDTKPTDSPGVRLAELTGGPMEAAQPTTKPSGGFLSMLAALAAMPTTQPSTPIEQELYVRRAERIIRGGSEGTIYYQRRASGEAKDDGWSVTSVGADNNDQKGLFK
jgi:pilus assembly protein CpaB